MLEFELVREEVVLAVPVRRRLDFLCRPGIAGRGATATADSNASEWLLAERKQFNGMVSRGVYCVDREGEETRMNGQIAR